LALWINFVRKSFAFGERVTYNEKWGFAAAEGEAREYAQFKILGKKISTSAICKIGQKFKF